MPLYLHSFPCAVGWNVKSLDLSEREYHSTLALSRELFPWPFIRVQVFKVTALKYLWNCAFSEVSQTVPVGSPHACLIYGPMGWCLTHCRTPKSVQLLSELSASSS